MATVNSNLALKQQPLSLGSSRIMPTECGGRVRQAVGKFVPAGTEVAGTVINLAKLPKGARLLPSSKLYIEAGQDADLTIKVGDAGDDDRYYAAAKPGATAAVISLAANAHGDSVLDAEGFILITTGAKPLAAAAISFELFYVID